MANHVSAARACFRFFVIPTVAAFALAETSARTEQSAPTSTVGQQTPTFRTRTDLVELDVSVLDRNRKPVRGLSTTDFTVLEDGKPQEISILEPVEVSGPTRPETPWMRETTPDVVTNERPATRLWVIAVDDALIPQDPATVKASKKIVTDIIDKFGPDDLAAVVFTTDSRQAQDFTNDRTKLLSTLDRYSPGNASWSGTPDAQINVDPDWQFQLGAVLTLRSIVEAVASLSHERKALIWISPGVPQDFIPVTQEIPRGGAPGTMAEKMHQLKIIDLAKEVYEVARRSNVPIYSIDPCGFGGLKAYVSGRARYNPPNTGAATEFLLTSALNTGGHAIVHTNDFGPGIESVFEENSFYYRIGYYSSNLKADGGFRRLEVKVKRDNVDVRTRSGYLAARANQPAPKSANDILAKAITVPIPISDLPMRASAAPFAARGRNRTATVVIALGITQPVPEAASKERVTVNTNLRVAAYTTEGQARDAQVSVAKVVIRAGAQGDAHYEALARIDLPPGRYRLRLAAFHQLAAQTGTVMVDTIVPDFSGLTPTVSGVVISASPGLPSAPRDLLQDVLPMVPTAQRTFSASERVNAFFRMYQNAGRSVEPARVTTTIVSRLGSAVFSDEQTIPVSRFSWPESESQPGVAPRPPGGPIDALRAAPVQFRLPLNLLAPGPYLLRFEIAMGQTKITREVQFSVQ